MPARAVGFAGPGRLPGCRRQGGDWEAEFPFPLRGAALGNGRPRATPFILPGPHPLARRMSHSTICTETAESILEHAAAMARLDVDALGAEGYKAACETRIRAIRLIAVSHVDPQPDRELVRQLRGLSADVPGVFVHLVDGEVEVIVDSASAQHAFTLWTHRQMRADEEDRAGTRD